MPGRSTNLRLLVRVLAIPLKGEQSVFRRCKEYLLGHFHQGIAFVGRVTEGDDVTLEDLMHTSRTYG